MNLYATRYFLTCVIWIADSSLAELQLDSCSLSCSEPKNRENIILRQKLVGLPGKAGVKGSRGFPGLNGEKGDPGAPGTPCACPRYDEISKRVEDLEKEMAEVFKLTGWTNGGNNIWYKMIESTSNYSTAKANCEFMNARLASTGLRNKSTTRKLYEIIGGSGVWIGLDDIQAEGIWMWSDGVKDTGSSLWYPGEPNNSGGNEDCAIAFRHSNDLKLNDGTCSDIRKAVCEKNA